MFLSSVLLRALKYLTVFFLENRLVCLNNKFLKREGKLWTYTDRNNPKAKLDYIFINKKWINSVFNCEAYSSLKGVSSDQRIVSAKIRVNLG